jgi:hypothetical protein
MALFVVSGSGVQDLVAQNFTGFTGIDFQTNGATRLLLSSAQFQPALLTGAAEFDASQSFASIVEMR